MYGRKIVPDGFAVPEKLAGDGFHLRMLSIEDVEKDYAAVVASTARLKGLLDPESDWPEGLTLREDLVDLGWHEREFTLRRSFAYTVMSADESQCLGCVYIFPSEDPAFEAAVFYWARDGRDWARRDEALGRLVRDWMAAWPFARVAFPGRDIPWPRWRADRAL